MNKVNLLVKSGNKKLKSQKTRKRFKLRSLVFFPKPWKGTLFFCLAIKFLPKIGKITLCLSYCMFRNYSTTPMASHLIVGGVPWRPLQQLGSWCPSVYSTVGLKLNESSQKRWVACKFFLVPLIFIGSSCLQSWKHCTLQLIRNSYRNVGPN